MARPPTIECHLHPTQPLIAEAFERIHASFVLKNSHARQTAFALVYKHLNHLEEAARKSHIVRFLAFALRVRNKPSLIRHTLTFIPAAINALDAIILLHSGEDADAEIARHIMPLTFELTYGNHFAGMCNSRSRPIAWFLPIHSWQKGPFDKLSNILPKLHRLDYCFRLILLDWHETITEVLAPGAAAAAQQDIKDLARQTSDFLTITPCSYQHLIRTIQIISDEAEGELLMPNADWADTTGKTLLCNNLPISISHIRDAIHNAFLKPCLERKIVCVILPANISNMFSLE